MTEPDDNDYVISIGDIVDDDMGYMRAHLCPDTDPIARAICEKLSIDWAELLKENE